jgi:hypothetical protein
LIKALEWEEPRYLPEVDDIYPLRDIPELMQCKTENESGINSFMEYQEMVSNTDGKIKSLICSIFQPGHAMQTLLSTVVTLGLEIGLTLLAKPWSPGARTLGENGLSHDVKFFFIRHRRCIHHKISI